MWPTLVTIFFIQIVYVTVLTIRQIFTLKGYRYTAAMLSSIDIMIYVIGFKIVLDHLDQPVSLVVYCLSYGVGILTGIKIEERLALGFTNVQVFTKQERHFIVQELSKKGYGLTIWEAEGVDGKSLVLSIIILRKKQSRLYQDIMALDPAAFVVSYDAKYYRGGYLMRPGSGARLDRLTGARKEAGK
ncbi:DUF2179 domain-containing protein [Paenibacillus radicis (ex Xue et al. 2023)]|uniref:UPF0316 protein NV381_14840 n=1 Tax=Paenibacillus radicis (ex Xue et al. 2023) TaxID=2972489 RepID=A0ABT1YIB8_9BACL|nr:DUF2179 domain-containing protein [Paenibacillus radicis (ex Xue et al. 2023)]MCR8632480.1 DUF2179 domain-containing protein [Paenibacillus radicis (ex Xue et al. 2023)]